MDILVGLDGTPWSEAATRAALSCLGGERSRHRLTGLHVLSVTRRSGRHLRDLASFLGFEPVLVPEQVEAFYRRYGDQILATFTEACTAAGVAGRPLLEQGNAAERLVRHGDRADLVFLGARGEGELDWPGHGGTTVERVVRSLGSPAIVVPQDQGPLTGILLSYDGSDGAARALRATRLLLGAIQAPVHAVQVLDSPGARSHLDEVREHLAGLGAEVHTHARAGEPREVLVAAAEELGCNLIALGYRGRGVGDMFLGRVTEYLLRYVPAGLLIAR